MVGSELSRRERKKRRTRERIVGEAVRIFTDKGIGATTVDEIADAADVGKDTIYNYFQTKEDIVVAFLVDLEAHVQSETSRLVRTRGSLESVLTRLVRFQFKLKEPHHAFVRVLLSRMMGQSAGDSDWMAALQSVIDPHLAALFNEFGKRGAIRPDLPPERLVQAFKVVHLGLTILWAIEGSPWSGTDQAVKDQMRLFCEGVEVKGR